jgi:hypothetical protein
MKIEDPLPDFLTNSSTPSKEFENDSASTYVYYIEKLELLPCVQFWLSRNVETG